MKHRYSCIYVHIYGIYTMLIYRYMHLEIVGLSHLIVLNEFWSHSFLRLAEHEANCVGCETHHFA